MNYQLTKQELLHGFVKACVVTGHSKILHNEELYDLHALLTKHYLIDQQR
jgi:hypothetical protein